MTDLGEIIATLERNQQESRERDAVLSERIKVRLSNARLLLENGNGNGSGPVATANAATTNGTVDPVYEEIRRSLDEVDRIARDLQAGRY